MELYWSKSGWSDYQYWKQNDMKILKKINRIIKEILINPFTGIGNPEPLKHNLQGYWSRRINREHRIIYIVKGEKLIISACKNHY